MADAEKYAEWIINNSDKKGTPEFQTVVNAYQAAKIDAGRSSRTGDFIQGGLSSAANVASSLMYPVNKLLSATGIMENTPAQQRQATQELVTEGADVEGLPFKGGKLVGDIANAVSLTKMLPSKALQTGGFNLGGLQTTNKLLNAGLRAGAGGIAGGTVTGVISPEDWKTGAGVGMALPVMAPLVKEGMKSVSNKLMQSAIKPTIADLKTGKAQKAVQTLLEEGVNPTKERTIFGRGLDVLQDKVTKINTQIDDIITNSKGKVSKQTVLSYLDDLQSKAMRQVNPADDLAAIEKARISFAQHPLAQGDDIPISLAQDIKKGTYKSLGNKAYGELKGVDIEAQKSLARGLREGVGKAEPAVMGLNAQEQKLLNALSVAERRALMELNNNPVGIAGLSQNPSQLMAMLADRSGAFKALVARMIYNTQKAIPSGGLLNVQSGVIPNVEETE
jgi:hypothetical protein